MAFEPRLCDPFVMVRHASGTLNVEKMGTQQLPPGTLSPSRQTRMQDASRFNTGCLLTFIERRNLGKEVMTEQAMQPDPQMKGVAETGVREIFRPGNGGGPTSHTPALDVPAMAAPFRA